MMYPAESFVPVHTEESLRKFNLLLVAVIFVLNIAFFQFSVRFFRFYIFEIHNLKKEQPSLLF